jgi:hypothetical protein
MKPTLFTGVPALRPAAKPSIRAQILNGTLKPRTGVDHLLFGLAPFVAFNALDYLKGNL